jgi:two-component sensor histidine kinase
MSDGNSGPGKALLVLHDVATLLTLRAALVEIGYKVEVGDDPAGANLVVVDADEGGWKEVCTAAAGSGVVLVRPSLRSFDFGELQDLLVAGYLPRNPSLPEARAILCNATRQILLQKDMLLRELRHRIKNNLAMLASVASIEASLVEEGRGHDAILRLRDRIVAVGVIYDRLGASVYADRVHIASYLGLLAQELREGYLGTERNVAIETDFEDVEVDSKVALTIGLVMTELVTNAAKHAFPEGRSGRIRTSFRSSPSMALLEVEDNGVGLSRLEAANRPAFPLPKEGEGLGLTLAQALAEGLKGKLEKGDSSTGSGSRIALLFPLAAMSGEARTGDKEAPISRRAPSAPPG